MIFPGLVARCAPQIVAMPKPLLCPCYAHATVTTHCAVQDQAMASRCAALALGPDGDVQRMFGFEMARDQQHIYTDVDYIFVIYVIC